jgi:hypothetical protein
VQVVERWILARLRHRTFFRSLAELNAAIAELLVELNERPFQKLPGSRRSLFERLDRPALKALPEVPYELRAEWRRCRAGTVTDAILDRLLHNAHRIALSGDSMRKTSEPPAQPTA